MRPSDLSYFGKQAFKWMEFDDKEQLIYEIRKHPFGLFLIYIVGTFIILAMLGIALFGAMLKDDPLNAGLDVGLIRSLLVGLGLVLAILSLVAMAIEAYIYQANVILVTTDKLSQLLYKTIFDRQISQLSIGDVQDVSVRQQGIFARIFNYGTLTVETAGEQNNYVFTFAPKPHACAKAIQYAHEGNLKLYGN